MAEVATAINTALGSFAGDALTGAASIVTTAFPVAAVLIGIGFLIKAVKKVVGR